MEKGSSKSSRSLLTILVLGLFVCAVAIYLFINWQRDEMRYTENFNKLDLIYQSIEKYFKNKGEYPSQITVLVEENYLTMEDITFKTSGGEEKQFIYFSPSSNSSSNDKLILSAPFSMKDKDTGEEYRIVCTKDGYRKDIPEREYLKLIGS